MPAARRRDVGCTMQQPRGPDASKTPRLVKQGTAGGRISRGVAGTFNPEALLNCIQLTCLAGRGGPGLSYFRLTRSADVAQGQKE